MALTRAQIVEAAMTILRNYGLEDLSMRRLAKDLDVQPGTLYWHIKSKQDLLTVLAEMILKEVPTPTSARELAVAIRGALLSVRDGAEVVALALALSPETLAPLRRFRQLVADGGLAPREATWLAQALVNYIIGTVSQEQTRAGLHRAGILDAVENDTDAAFEFGLDLLLSGLHVHDPATLNR